MEELEFRHRFVPGRPSGEGITLLLLHGTGGSETDLIPLGEELAPGAALLSPRGKVLENGMPRFFRRLAEGVFDQEDLQRQTDAMAQFMEAASRQYGLSESSMVAVGYSNGANIASSVLLRYPSLLAAAMLFRAMVPFQPQPPPDLRHARIFLAAGRRDPIVQQSETNRLAGILEAAGAEVATHWHDGGHELGRDDIAAAKAWISEWRAQR
jgi:phospholipase/carboxylesterase/glyoxalase family protein